MKVNYKTVVGICALVLSSSIFAADIGVIPDKKCPANSKTITIYMDDEDTSNASKLTGWVGDTSRKTKFKFCRINSEAFKPLSNGEDYAVLQLSESCPADSISFYRYFDNENTHNNNSFTGNIYPNSVGRNTRLKFCYFEGRDQGMDSFPDIGIAYGVFAPKHFSKSLASGTIYTDDENKNNANKLNVYGHNAIKSIIHGTHNTTLHVHKVKENTTVLTSGEPKVRTVDRGTYKYYKIYAHAGDTVKVDLYDMDANANLYVRVGSKASKERSDCKSVKGGHSHDAIPDSCSVTVNKDSDVYVSVYAPTYGCYNNVEHTIMASIRKNVNKKELILHPKSRWHYLYPSYYASHADYINTLPFSGFTIIGDTFTDKVMKHDATEISRATIFNELKVMKDLYTEKSNFLEVRMHFPGDFWDNTDTWDNVIANFGTLASVANELGFRGIIYDNEAYHDQDRKMINYDHNITKYDKRYVSYKNPKHTFVQHSERITALFKKIMEAMVRNYETIDVLYYHSPVEGHQKGDHGIVDEDGETHPVVVDTTEHTSEWQGAMFLGLKKGLSHQATLHDMGEDYKLRTQKHFDDAYEWRKYTIASNDTNEKKIDSTKHWIVPVDERASWAKEVHVDFMVSNEPLTSFYHGWDTTNKVSLKDMNITLKRALDKSDKYVVFFSASKAGKQGGLVHLDWLEVDEPNAHDKQGKPYILNPSLDPAWKGMMEEIYRNKVRK